MYKFLKLTFLELSFSKNPDSSINMPNSLIFPLAYIKNGEEFPADDRPTIQKNIQSIIIIRYQDIKNNHVFKICFKIIKNQLEFQIYF